MAAIFMDGYDHYGTDTTLSASNMASGVYSSVQNVKCGVPTWGAAATGAACLAFTGSAPQGARFALPTPGTNFFVSFRYAVDTLVTGGPACVGFLDSGGNTLFCLTNLANGALALRSGDNTGHPELSTILAQTAGPVIVSQNWHFFELEVDSSAHTFVLRVDDAVGTGTPILSVSNSGVTGTISLISMIHGVSSSSPVYIDDLFIRDASGSFNNDWLGDRRVATLYANTDTATSGWAPSYYQEFGDGILRVSYKQAGSSSAFNPDAYLWTPADTSLDIGPADFTLETFIRFDDLPAATHYSTIFNRWDTVANQRSFRLILGGSTFNNGCLEWDISTDGATPTAKVQYPWTPETNVWYHVAMVRAAGELLLFVDGQQLGLPIADSSTYFAGSEIMSVGLEAQFHSGSPVAVDDTNVIGRMDETRFTNGTGRYTAPFSPPVAAFPRGGSDPDWAQVVLLMGYDSPVIVDESSFARTITAAGNAIAFMPTDGAAVGAYSTVNKATPDDNTFIAASLLSATNTLTMTVQPSNGDTITVGTTDGTTAAVYTFKNTLASAFDVKIGANAQTTLINLLNAINAGAGSGTAYGAGTTSNFDVNASQLPVGQIEVFANTAGSAGNSIASTHTGTAASWATTTLTGGANIPGPTNFKVQRPPNNTTLISAMQMNVRALKTDAGTATIQSTFVGSHSGTDVGTAKNLTVSASYYRDMIETDPDTSGALSPTTIINGQFSINRTA